MKKLGYLSFMFLFAVLTALVAPIDALAREIRTVTGERRALLIAVSKYTDRTYGELPNAESDVNNMKDALLSSGYVEKDIRILQLPDILPTREIILTELKKFAESCEADDVALVMMTGRGTRDESTKKNYYVPLDAKGRDFNTLVSFDEVADILGASRAKDKLLVIDASSNLAQGKEIFPSIGVLQARPGMLILQSCAPEENSLLKDEQNGLFAYHFAEGLKGGAINDDGIVSVLGSFEYAREKVGAMGDQHPVMIGSEFTDLAFCENKEWIQAADHYKKALEAAEEGDYASAQKETQLASIPYSPLRDRYLAKAKSFEQMASKRMASSVESSGYAGTKVDSQDGALARSVAAPNIDDVALPVVKGARRALLISVSQYNRDSYKIADNDVDLMKETLLKSGFDKRNITVMKSSESWGADSLTGKKIMEAIKESADSCGDKDFLFVMLTGTGVRDQKTKEDYLIPYDAITMKNSDFNNLNPATLVALNEATDILRDCKAQFKTLLLDADRMNGKGRGNSSIGLLTAKSGLLILQSCKPEETSHNDGKYGNFVSYFAEGLQGKAVRDNGRLSIQDAFAYAQGKVRDGKDQHPVIASIGFNDFEICTHKDWVSAADSFKKSDDAFNAGDYILALEEIQKATELASPLSDKFKLNEKETRLIALVDKVKPGALLDASMSAISSAPTGAETTMERSVAKPSEPIAGEEKRIPINGTDEGMTFRYCPAGTFDMGSPDDEKGRTNYEMQHSVVLTQGFWMMETTVTREIWTAVMGASPNMRGKENWPVTNVSWYDCQQFIDKLNSLDVAPAGWKFALPTEAQWEYACRASTLTAYSCGEVLTSTYANFGKKSNGSLISKSAKGNAWHIYDMSGNVWEWTQDVYAPYQNTKQTDPCITSGSEDKRVVRGGCYKSDAKDCRSAARNSLEPEKKNSTLGFRCVLVPEK